MGKRSVLAAMIVLGLFFGVSSDARAQLIKKPSSDNKGTTKKKKPAPAEDLDNSAEPDKMLYERAQTDLKHNRYTEGRLALQTLINTYPDSEYLAKAKLAIADSYFKEGGTSNLMQSIQEYKDFNTFFPFLDEAAYSQMQIGMAHYKMMEKADRDTAQGQMAEDELQTMLLKYPQSPLAPQAEQRLREVQEVLADGSFKVAHYYYAKGDTHAAGARLIEISDRYPLYSGSDEVLWLLGDIYMKTKLASKDEDVRNVWGAQAARCYDRILRDYPLSKHASDAKARLQGMGMKPPAPDPDALARMRKEQEAVKQHRSTFGSMLNSPMSMLHSGPDVSAAAHSGQPNLNPPTDAISATEILKPQKGGPSMNVGATATVPGSDNGPTTQVEAVPYNPATSSGTDGLHAGVQIITPMENSGTAPATSAPPAESSSVSAAGNPPGGSTSAQPSPASGNPAPAAPSAPVAQTGSSAQTPAGSAQGSSSSAPAASANSQPAAAGQPAAAQSSTDGDDTKESSSKKKKGLRKLIPW